MRLVAVLVGLVALMLAGKGGAASHAAPKPAPNILFVIMDDVGIDQMEAFGYGGETPPSTPNIADIAKAGIRFHNTWAMPACTTSRAVFFDARFPLRTQVKGALGPNDLANSMVSPFEMTVPKLLAQQRYDSALFGKFHLALQGNNPAGLAMPHNLGWIYFAGWLDPTGDPHSIDKTAGGVAPDGVSYPCGFVPADDGDPATGGADSGACYSADGSCRDLTASGPVPPGRTCRDQGGILVPNKTCQTSDASGLLFENPSGHYVSPLVYNYPDGSVDAVPYTDPRARRFRAALAVDEAIDWINDRPAGRPWMATVSFASDHTPLMQPPADADLPGSVESSTLDCSDAEDQRVISDLMIESLDSELGRLLVATGLAKRQPNGRLNYRPHRTDTVLIILGDNGSLAGTVKDPFDPKRAKGTAYQTGVWVPLVVAGPLVTAPNRVVTHMVNIADLFALFGEIAGIPDVRAAVPRPIDAMPMLPYLTKPNQSSIRSWNYTEVGVNQQIGGAINQPCVINGACTQIPVSQSVCTDNNGVWWGQGADDPTTAGIPEGGYQFCCQVNAWRDLHEEELYTITPLVSVAIRNDQYKIVENTVNEYISQEMPCLEMITQEFYEIDEAVPVPKLDLKENAIPVPGVTQEQRRNYAELSAQLAAIRASAVACPGDGNIDFVVDQLDLDDWQSYADSWGFSSVYDLNFDGLTDAADESKIEQYLGADCRL